jgi:hypothetical protein
MWKHAMKTVVLLVLALLVGQTPLSALEPQRVDVRDMENWSIIVSKDALESERPRRGGPHPRPTWRRAATRCATS